MLKGHPKGLIVAFFANMGERFGFYTMMAILVLFLQVKYGLSEEQAGSYYSSFYFGIYALALIGGLVADSTNKYKLVIFGGILIMLTGYILMSIPGLSLTLTLASLFIIAFGNGMFKGNLQAVVGQLYDNPKYSKLRDSAFMVFYMGINVGAFFAPFAATGVRNWWLKTNGYLHDGSLPSLCHQYIDGKLADPAQFQLMAQKATISGQVGDLGQFAQNYLDVFSRGYNYAFGIAAGAMVLSMLVYIFFHKHLPNKEKVTAANKVKIENGTQSLFFALLAAGVAFSLLYFGLGVLDIAMAVSLFVAFATWIILASNKEEKPKVMALIMVFIVVIFFWMSFHQNGLTLTFFARDYIAKEVGPITNLFFGPWSIISVFGALAGLFVALGKNKTRNERLIGIALFVFGSALAYYYVQSYEPSNAIAPEIFQSFNPLFIVFLTPLVMSIFAWLNKKEIEPSTPKKIGFGMIIAAVAFMLILVSSLNMVSPHTLDGQAVPDSSRVTPYWLINGYLIFTIAELFLSPMGLSFVSKVAPPRFQGLMQGGWLLATAVGNKLLVVGSFFWSRLDLWMLWSIFIVCCLLSAAFMFSMLKKLERVTN
jgi:POT family proton-dependent oligopeptide transporter